MDQPLSVSASTARPRSVPAAFNGPVTSTLAWWLRQVPVPTLPSKANAFLARLRTRFTVPPISPPELPANTPAGPRSTSARS